MNTHLVKFHETLHAFRLASGVTMEDDPGRKLIMLMNNLKEARMIANMGIIQSELEYPSASVKFFNLHGRSQLTIVPNYRSFT